MRFYAYHGVLPQEQAVGNWFVVDLALKVDVTPATRSDQLSDTLNYAEIYALVEKEMRQPSALLEHAAGRIIRRLGEQFPQIEAAEVALTKERPPFKGQVAGATIILREQYH